jgi:hypothetical protein
MALDYAIKLGSTERKRCYMRGHSKVGNPGTAVMPLRGTWDNENGLRSGYVDRGRFLETRSILYWCPEPAGQCDRDGAAYLGLSPLAVGEHAELTAPSLAVFPRDVAGRPRRDLVDFAEIMARIKLESGAVIPLFMVLDCRLERQGVARLSPRMVGPGRARAGPGPPGAPLIRVAKTIALGS